MIKNNRNNEQIYGRNDMIMLDPNNKIYGSLGLADNYVMKTEEGTKLTLSNPKLGSFDDVLTEFNIYGMSKQESTTGANLIDIDNMLNECLVKNVDDTYSILKTETNRFSKKFPINLKAGTAVRFDADVIEYNGTYSIKLQVNFGGQQVSTGGLIFLKNDVTEVTIYQDDSNDVGTYTKFKNAILSVGEAKVPYEPYTGGKPSPSPDYPQEIKSVVNPVIKVCGKNLFDFSRLVSDGVNVMNYDNQTITVPAYTNNTGYNQTLHDLCPGITSGTYVFSMKRSNPNSNNGSYFLESAKDFPIDTPFKLTDELLDNHIAWYNSQDSDVENVISEIQIEKGTEATDYEPYHEEQTITIPCTLNAIQVGSGGNVIINGQQYIADYVDVERGKLYKKVKRINVKDVEDINVAYGSHLNGNGYLSLNVGNVNVDISPISNQYRSSMWTSKSGYVYIPESGFIVIVDDRFTDRQTAIKRVQDTYVIYALASQIEINLAPEVIEQYKKLSVKAQTTIIENNYSTWMKATYKSTESV